MRNFVFVLLVTVCFNVAAQNVRERIRFDKDWYFAFGLSFDKSKDL